MFREMKRELQEIAMTNPALAEKIAANILSDMGIEKSAGVKQKAQRAASNLAWDAGKAMENAGAAVKGAPDAAKAMAANAKAKVNAIPAGAADMKNRYIAAMKGTDAKDYQAMRDAMAAQYANVPGDLGMMNARGTKVNRADFNAMLDGMDPELVELLVASKRSRDMARLGTLGAVGAAGGAGYAGYALGNKEASEILGVILEKVASEDPGLVNAYFTALEEDMVAEKIASALLKKK